MIHRPDYITGKAIQVWKRLAPYLDKQGLLTEQTVDIVCAMSKAYGLYLECQERLENEGLVVVGERGRMQANPLISIAQTCLQQYYRGYKELGLGKPKPPAPTTELDDFIGAE